jgi:hypothetical protein
MRENKEEVERHNRQISKQGVTLNLWLAHWKYKLRIYKNLYSYKVKYTGLQLDQY